MPLVFIALLVLVRVEIDYVEEYKETKYQSFELDSNVWIQYELPKLSIYY